MNANDWPHIPGIPDNALQVFAIFDHPLDWPRFWVVRRQFGVPWKEGMPGLRPHPDDPCPVVQDVVPRLAVSLAEARALVPQGLYRQPRVDGDDLTLAECWY